MSVSDADRVRALRKQLRPRVPEKSSQAGGDSEAASIDVGSRLPQRTAAGRIADLEYQVRVLSAEVSDLKGQVADMQGRLDSL